MTQKISVFGAGSWGTALAQTLARNGNDVLLWSIDPKQVEAIQTTRHNPQVLSEYELLPNITATSSIEEAAKSSDYWVMAVPTQVTREVLTKLKPFATPDKKICNAAKGIEISSLQTVSNMAAEIIPQASFSVISGPSHAEEVIANLPAALVVASDLPEAAKQWQHIFNQETFRVYTSSDVTGVEIGAAVKNVIAIASGLVHSMKMGDNATAALVSRGLAEIVRLGNTMGANQTTLSGLAGIGDLMVTAYSRHSRNFRLGEYLGQGLSLDEASQKLGQVAEGAYTVKAIHQLSQNLNVELPICSAVYSVLYNGTGLPEALRQLLSREPKPEYPN